MGNAGSTNVYRERQKSADISASNSPFRELQTREADAVGANANQVTEQAFTFNKKRELVIHTGSSQEDEETTSEPYYTKSISKTSESHGTAVESEFITPIARKRSSTISDVTTSINNTSNVDNRENNENKVGFEGEYDSEEKTSNDALENDAQDYRNQAMPTVLRWDGGGKQVLISGTFTKWKPIPMVRSHGNFVTIIDLPEGDHQYKFCVDGEWKHDPKLNSIQTPEGDMTNLVTVRQSDFEVFQALAKDSEQMATQTEREYTQDVPQIKPWEKVSGPPILPPHLLQVILNKDTPLSCEPTLLPEPNHVMLNHLYALSIKDGVMVLSATHRYRKKYVTTLLYKPI